MLGRFTAALLAVLAMTLLSVKKLGVNEAERCENEINYALEEFVCVAERKGSIGSADIERLYERISLSGALCYVGVEIGTVLYGLGEKRIDVIYYDEVQELILAAERDGEELDIKGCLITVYAIPLKDGLGITLANMFWESYIPCSRMVMGGYIHG